MRPLQLASPHVMNLFPSLLLISPLGCGDTCAPVAMCRPLHAWPNDTTSTATSSAPPPCPVWNQWCPYVSSCLPLSRPCQPGSCPNCSGVEPLPPGTLRPHYSLVGEVVFSLTPGGSTHTLVRTLESPEYFPLKFIYLYF